MGRHRREYPTEKLRLKYPKNGYDKEKAYTLYYEYTWLDAAPIRKDTGIRVKVDNWNKKGFSGKGALGIGADNIDEPCFLNRFGSTTSVQMIN